MPATIRVNRETALGEDVEVVIDGTPHALEWLGGSWWGAVGDFAGAASYFYRVVAAGEVIAVEAEPHRVAPGQTDSGAIVDRWRQQIPERLSRHSAFFSRALAARHPASGDGGAGAFRFRLHEPWLPPETTVGLVGSSPQLGEWDPARALPLATAGFPWWEVQLDLEDSAVEYKYVLLDGSSGLVGWESGMNRSLPPTLAGGIVTDDEFRGLAPWRGAGVAVPVFSLRTERGVGTGQFSDLKPFADWAKDAGLAVIQLLPVNDTVLEHGWDDSYPYNPNSVHALHPLYVDVDAIDGHGIGPAIDRARTAFGSAAEIDYVAVMEAKWALLRAAYANVVERLDNDETFAEFVDSQWSWLGAYSVWSLLRDRHADPDPANWEGYESFSPATVDAMADPASPDYDELRFYWFVQYHLHRQLNDAAAYIRSIGVALKGDLPIGVAPESVDVWARPELFHVGTQTGAPPDAFAREGQNWGFPTYNWDRMAADGYSWWQDRFRALASYVDVYRIDHVLGFFRIWEIPGDGFDGLVGHFRPSIPLNAAEVQAALGDDDIDRFTEPAAPHDPGALFGEHAQAVLEAFFETKGRARLAPDYRSQQAIRHAFASGALAELPARARSTIQRGLLDIAADVLLVTVDGGFAPSIAWQHTTHFARLPAASQEQFDALAVDFFHHRHRQQWAIQGRRTLPAIVGATDLLACGEDLGMVPDIVPGLMNEMGLLGLEIERMPKRLGEWIADPANAPYLSVVSPGTHDTSTLRQWWEEDPALTARYWTEALGQLTEPPATATPEVVAAIVERQLASPAMLCIIPIADLLGVDGNLRRDDIDAERINDPANRHNRWRYRMHLAVSALAAESDFNDRIREMVRSSGRRV